MLCLQAISSLTRSSVFLISCGAEHVEYRPCFFAAIVTAVATDSQPLCAQQRYFPILPQPPQAVNRVLAA
jgi:hypothetical protein